MMSVLMMFLAVVCATSPLYGEDEVTALLMEYEQLAHSPQGRETLADEETRTEWIGRLGSVLQQHPEHRSVAFLNYHLAHLYHLSGDSSAALDILDRVASNTNLAPGNRLTAASNAVNTAFSSGMPAAETFAWADRYEELFVELKDDLEAGADQRHTRNVLVLDMRKAEWLEAQGRRQAEQLQAERKMDAANDVLLSHLAASQDYYQAFLEGLKAAPETGEIPRLLGSMNWGPEYTMYRAARQASEMAGLYELQGRMDSRQESLQHAAGLLESFFDRYPRTEHSQNCGAELLRVKRKLLHPHDFAGYARELIPAIAPGHEVLSALRSIVWDFSQAEDDVSRMAAVALADLLCEASEAWYPDAYENHVNYKAALLAKAIALLAMDDALSAQDVLDVLGKLELRNDFFATLHQQLLDECAIHRRKEMEDLAGEMLIGVSAPPAAPRISSQPSSPGTAEAVHGTRPSAPSAPFGRNEGAPKVAWPFCAAVAGLAIASGLLAGYLLFGQRGSRSEEVSSKAS